MGFIKVFSTISSVFLYIYNILLMIAGIIILAKGLYALAYAREYNRYLMGRLLGIDELYREIGMSYVMPALLMIVIAYFGLKAAGAKVYGLVIYAGLTVMLMSASSYGVSQPTGNKFSLYSYLNRIFISEDLGLLSNVAYPEFGIQIAMLVSTGCILLDHYMEKRKVAKAEETIRHIGYLRNLQGLISGHQPLVENNYSANPA